MKGATAKKKVVVPNNTNTTLPTFPNDWSAEEKAHLVINQGGKPDADGNLCCAHAVVGECQVQSEYQHGQKYFDYSNKRTRFEDSVSGEITVNDYKKNKEMLVVYNSTLGYDICQECVVFVFVHHGAASTIWWRTWCLLACLRARGWTGVRACVRACVRA